MVKIVVQPQGVIIDARKGGSLLDALVKAGVFVSAPCGGRGVCGKCGVRVLSGSVDGAEINADGVVLSCRARLKTDLTVSVPKSCGKGLDELFVGLEPDGNAGCVAALDIGTTTLAAAVADGKTGEVLARTSALNPQGALGADIMSRISAYESGRGEVLTGLIRSAINEILDGFSTYDIRELTVSANNTMLHILSGVSPVGMGKHPFEPAFTEMQGDVGAHFALKVPRVTLLPSASAFIGADAVAGFSACADEKSSVLFVDVGTNGEVVLSHRGRLLAASAAAGPALEGACIECGTGGVAGAVSSVSTDGRRVFVSTVDGEKPNGICGSGIIDAVAMLVKNGVVDETGAFDYECDSPLVDRLVDDRFYLTDGVYLTQRDIRQVQLAKAAIAATVRALLAKAEISANELDEVLLAGGIGHYMNAQSAVAISLLPRAKSIRSVGNAALGGALACALSRSAKQRAVRLAREIEVIDLNSDPVFSAEFINQMSF